MSIAAVGTRTLLITLAVALTACAGGERPTVSDETAPPPACSADGMTIAEIDAEGLAPPISAARQTIIDAALTCDYESLAAAAAIGPLEVLIDGDSVPVSDWEAREADGQPILRSVAGVLALTPATASADGSVTWPSAVEWQFSDVAPGEERQALVDVVGEDGVFGWAETGGYAGWRSTIAADGTWRSLLLGPAPD